MMNDEVTDDALFTSSFSPHRSSLVVSYSARFVRGPTRLGEAA